MTWQVQAVVALLLLLTVAPAFGSLSPRGKARPAEPSSENGPPSLGLTVVPPGPVTDRIEIEIRVSVSNRAAEQRQFQLRIDRTLPEGQEAITRAAMTVGGGETAFLSTWLSTSGLSGHSQIRVRIDSPGESLAEKTWPLTVVPAATRALPFLQGGWLDPLGLRDSVYPRNRQATADDVRDTIRSLKRLGMSLLTITYVEYFGSFFYPSDLTFHDRDVDKVAEGQWFSFDVVETVLAEADVHGLHVLIGLGRGGDTHLLWDGLKDPQRLSAGAELSKRVAAELWERYRHHRSFYGWYLTHEMSDLAAASAYYDPVAAFCHSLCPDKPVMAAPAGTPLVDSELLSRSKVDIFAYQDAVGAGYIPYEYTYNPRNRLPVLDEVYSAYRKAHAGSRKHLWADLEIWEMAGPKYEKPFAASFDRVRQQLEVEAKHVDMLTGYEVFGFLEDPASSLKLKDTRAAELYKEYQGYCATLRAPLLQELFAP